MSTSFLRPPSIPADAIDTPLGQAVIRFHAAMFQANDCLERCADACHLDDLAHANFAYGDRQLMLAEQAIVQARVALQLTLREIETRYAAAEPIDGDGTLFGGEPVGPYGEGR